METTATQPESRWSRFGPGISALHLFTLASLAIAKPLYDTTARDAAFFVVRGSRPVDILSLIAVLSLVIPGTMVLLMLAAGLVSRRTRLAVHYAMVAALCALYGAQFLSLVEGASGMAGLVAIPVLGLVAASLYALAKPVRQMLTAVSPICLAFPLLFVFNSQVGEVILPPKETLAKNYGVKLEKKPPIVFILLDELSVESLLDARGNIDEKRFPNLAVFAREAYWFRNTTTVANHTTNAIPAILTGKLPTERLLPNLHNYPDNLFILLKDSYKFNVMEVMTYLCPEELSWGHDEISYPGRMKSLLRDLSVVYLHIVIPLDSRHVLPPINNQWGNFGTTKEQNISILKPKSEEDFLRKGSAHLAKDRPAVFKKFIKRIDTVQPSFNFIHFMMPHGPHEYLPSGKKYLTNDEIIGVQTKEDEYIGPQPLVDKFHQRYLLQVAYVDTLLGDLINFLKEKKIYNEALIIFTSDHGVSYMANDYRRRLSVSNVSDLLFTLLLIKTPGQKRGIVSDFDAESIDILPTIADVLEIKIPWKASGVSLLNPSRPAHFVKKVLDEKGATETFSYRKLLEDKAAAHARNVRLFGLDEEGSTFYWFGKYKSLMGQPVSNFQIIKGDYVVEMEQSRLLFDHVDLNGHFLPAAINGKVRGGGRAPRVVVSLNDVIQAVADTDDAEGENIFYTILPEAAFRQGKNETEFYILSEEGGLRLVSSQWGENASYTLSKNEIISSKGEKFPVRDKVLIGHLDQVGRKEGNLFIEGWAANAEKSRLVDAVIVFSEGKFMHAGRTTELRPDVSQSLGKEGIERCGYKFMVPESSIEDVSGIRVFTVSEGVASELIYPNSLKALLKRIVKLLLRETSYVLNPDYIVTPEGTVSIVRGTLEGHLDILKKEGGSVIIAGWAADLKKKTPVDGVLIFEGNKFVAFASADTDRPDVGKAFGSDRLMKSGFILTLPVESIKEPGRVRLFAVSGKVSSEIIINN